MKLSDAAAAMNGELHGNDLEFDWVSIDSRSLNAGELFFAIRGDNFDGEAFVERASLAGACAAVLTKRQEDLDFPQIVVENTVHALGKLAFFKRENMQGKVIAITGSCGKTSVKGMLKNVLALHGTTIATHANQNNQIGVPLTILGADSDVDYLVVEAGTSFKGEIKYLTSIINPDVSVVTNVHAAHLEGFGSLEAIADEKSDIYSGGSRVPTAVVNACLLQYSSFTNKIGSDEVIVFSKDESSENLRGVKISAESIHADDYGRAQYTLQAQHQSIDIALSVLGLHQVENALAAAGCAIALKVPLETIKRGLEAYAGERGRMQVQDLSFGTLIDDTYNANPASISAAIDYLSAQASTILILGDMAELGKDAEIEHRRIGEYAKKKGIQHLYCVGYFADDYADAFGEGSRVFKTQDDVAHFVVEQIREQAMDPAFNSRGATILVKGSRSAKMDLVCRELERSFNQPEQKSNGAASQAGSES